MVLHTTFPTEIWEEYDHQCIVNNKSLAKVITNRSLAESSRELSNVGGWQSNDDLAEDVQFTDLISFVRQKLLKVALHNNYIDGLECVIVNMWANINPPGGYNQSHIHPNSLFSGVYFVKTPQNSGNLMLYDPRPGVQQSMPPRKKVKLPRELWRETYYDAVPGRIIMFPSWLWHKVETNKSSDTRISVSFNFIMR